MASANRLLEAAFDGVWYPTHPNGENCSGFLKSAGRAFGFDVPDKDANGIIAYLEQHSTGAGGSWVKLGVGQAGLTLATAAVMAGRLVVVGSTSSEYGQSHGHVAILLPKLGGPHRAPYVFGGGDPGPRSKGEKTIREVWRPSKHGVLRYFAHRTALLGPLD